jgi:hypothetical protein
MGLQRQEHADAGMLVTVVKASVRRSATRGDSRGRVRR